MAIERDDLLQSTIVSYPKAIPDINWLKHRLLWAERVGAIYPAGGPHPQTEADHATLEALDRLQGGSSSPFVAYRVDIIKSGKRMIDEVVTDFGLSREAVDPRVSSDEVPPGPHDSSGSLKWLPPDVDRSRLIYSGKMPSNLAMALGQTDLADVEDDGRYLRMRSEDDALRLMSILARYAEPARRNPHGTVLDPASQRAFDFTAKPLKQAGVSAVCIDVPLPTRVNNDVELERIVDFRMNDKNDQSRRQYLDTMSAMVRADRSWTSDDPDYLRSAIEKMNSEMSAAAQAYTKKLTLAGLLAGAVTAGTVTGTVIVPLLGGIDPVAVTSATAGGVSWVAGRRLIKMNRMKADGYIGSIGRGGVSLV